jgi:hypothetical protein
MFVAGVGDCVAPKALRADPAAFDRGGFLLQFGDAQQVVIHLWHASDDFVAFG